jgi:hypothetical protein
LIGEIGLLLIKERVAKKKELHRQVRRIEEACVKANSELDPFDATILK